jgi:hypothetical protein
MSRMGGGYPAARLIFSVASRRVLDALVRHGVWLSSTAAVERFLAAVQVPKAVAT